VLTEYLNKNPGKVSIHFQPPVELRYRQKKKSHRGKTKSALQVATAGKINSA